MKLALSSGIGLALAALALTLPAHATINQLTDPSQLTVGDGTFSFVGAGGTVASPVVVSNSGTVLTFTAAGGSFYEQTADGVSSDFAAGTPLLETSSGGSFATPTGPLTISFGPGVSEFGLRAQDFSADNEIFNFNVTGSQSGVTSFTTGSVDNTSNQGMAAFIGASGTPGDLISQVTISSVSDQLGGSNDFLVGNVTAPVPEPSTTAAMGLGILGLGALVFGARKRTLKIPA